MSTNTVIEYQYHDASNYKRHGQFVFAGVVSSERLAEFREAMPTRADIYPAFVPDQVGVPNLRDEMEGEYEDDTRWNEITGIEVTNALPDTSISFAEFVADCLRITASEAGWDDRPRIDYDTEILAANSDEAVTADRWFYQVGDEWIAVASTQNEEHWFEDLDPLDVPERRVRPIREVPKTGALRWRTKQGYALMDGPHVVDVVTPTPCQITITAEQIRTWSGRALTGDQLNILAERIPHSSIPEAINVILAHLDE